MGLHYVSKRTGRKEHKKITPETRYPSCVAEEGELSDIDENILLTDYTTAINLVGKQAFQSQLGFGVTVALGYLRL